VLKSENHGKRFNWNEKIDSSVLRANIVSLDIFINTYSCCYASIRVMSVIVIRERLEDTLTSSFPRVYTLVQLVACFFV